MSYSEEHLWGLLRQVEELPFGPARTALVTQVIADADAGGYANLSFHARMVGTASYVFGGEPARSFDTFAWCVAEFDRDPQAHAGSRLDLLWQFKSAVTAQLGEPDVPLSRVLATIADMERRWREGGHSPHAVYALRHTVARHIGDEAAAAYWYDRWVGSERDQLSDCAGCDPGRRVRWLSRYARWAEAIEVAGPVLDGLATCSEQPQGILTDLLEPYLRTGRLAEARDAHRRAYRSLRGNLAALSEVGDHLWFCGLSGNRERGLEIVERHLSWLDTPSSPEAAMRFASRAALVLRQVAALDPRRTVFRPEHGDRPAVQVPVGALAEELAELSVRLAARFDARNGSGYQSMRNSAVLAAEPVVPALPLTVPAQRRPERPRTAPAVRISAELGPDDLLDLAEQHYRRGEFPAAYAHWHAFDDRYASAALSTLQRARRADGYGLEAANGGDLPSAETAWRSAVGLYAEAGDELRRQTARGRLGLAYCVTERGESGLPIVEETTTYLLAHGPLDRRAGAFMSLSAAYGATGRHDEGLDALERAEEYASASPDPNIRIRLVIDRAQHLGAAGRVDRSREAALEGVRLARAAGFREGLARASWILGLAAEFQHDPQGAVDAYDDALAAAEDAVFERQVRRHRATLLAGSARAAEAIDDLAEALAADLGAGDTAGANALRHQLAIAYLNAGRDLDAAETAEAAVAGFEEAGDPHAHAVRHLLANANVRLGLHDEAIELLEVVEAHCLATSNPAGAGQMAEEIGDILDKLDRDAAAAARFAAAAERYREAELPVDTVRARRRYATSLLWSRDLPGALAALEEADLLSADLPATGDPAATWERAMLGYDGAKILSHDGRPAAAAVRAAAAAARFRSIEALAEAAHTEALRGELLMQAEHPGAAEQALRRALADLPDQDSEEARQRMADLLAEALAAQGREDEAAAVRAAHGIATGEVGPAGA
jgi:tetratricopeptide (TPR) repeat protein